MISLVSSEPVLAVDTESNSLFAYRERVCLIQISTPTTDYLIDPLAINNLSPLGPIFASSTQQKIFHAAEYDVICLKRDYGFTFSNVFDTMIAARILAEPQVGLGSLLLTYFSVQLDKRFQRADWGKRPLTPAMLDYARMDTHYLFALKQLLAEKLAEKGLSDLGREDFDLVCSVSQQETEPNGKSCWKVSGANQLTPQETAVLQSLCTYRDQYARQVDLPHFKVLSNDLLVEISRKIPGTLVELKEVPGMNSNLFRRHSEGLLKAVAEGLSTPPMKRQKPRRTDQEVLTRLNALHDWRKEQGKKLKIESDVVLPRDYMEKIAAKNPVDLAELKNLMVRIPWRYKHYGRAIFNAIHPKGSK